MSAIFARITKVDEERREVSGRATQEMIDRDNEVFDYKTSKPNFQAWSAEVYKDTDGKSLGNVRSMHGNTAAGKLTDIMFDDVEKAIDVTAKIVDDNEWKKVQEGVYTGFSIGGRYVRKWAEVMNGKMVNRYTASPNEISIVDRPCVTTAKFFTVHKRDGSIEERPFKYLIDLEKSGPGSGPHSGGVKAEAKNSQARTSARADYHAGMADKHSEAAKEATSSKDSAAHEDAAAEHAMAANAYRQAAEEHGKVARGQGRTFSAASHEQSGDRHRAVARAASSTLGMRAGKSDSDELEKFVIDVDALTKDGVAALIKGGPGSGPKSGASGKDSKQEHLETKALEHSQMASEHATQAKNDALSSKEQGKHAVASEMHSAASQHFSNAADARAKGANATSSKYEARGEKAGSGAYTLSNKTK